MQKDMHYYGTYAMARAAGLAPNACQIIATAAEFVDDNGEKEVIEFPDGGRLDFVPTAHHATDIANIDRHDQRLVWVPFHFIPGNEGRSMSERLLCRKDSEIAREMIDHNLPLTDKTFGLHLAGITAHVYADTFSHYGFSGVSSRWNRIDASSFEFCDVEPEIRRHLEEKKNRFRERYGKEIGHLPNIRNPESWNHHMSGAISRLKDRFIGSAAEILSGALGHGAAVTYPDRPFLRWQFDYEHPKRRPSGLRDNPATFLEACEKLHGMFHRLGKWYPDAKQEEGRSFDDIREVVARILAKQAPREAREKAWKNAAKAGDLFVRPESILPYQGATWRRGLDSLRRATDSRKALDKHVFHFFQAAAVHRTFVLRDLLPRYGMVVD